MEYTITEEKRGHKKAFLNKNQNRCQLDNIPSNTIIATIFQIIDINSKERMQAYILLMQKCLHLKLMYIQLKQTYIQLMQTYIQLCQLYVLVMQTYTQLSQVNVVTKQSYSRLLQLYVCTEQSDSLFRV